VITHLRLGGSNGGTVSWGLGREREPKSARARPSSRPRASPSRLLTSSSLAVLSNATRRYDKVSSERREITALLYYSPLSLGACSLSPLGGPGGSRAAWSSLAPLREVSMSFLRYKRLPPRGEGLKPPFSRLRRFDLNFELSAERQVDSLRCCFRCSRQVPLSCNASPTRYNCSRQATNPPSAARSTLPVRRAAGRMTVTSWKTRGLFHTWSCGSCFNPPRVTYRPTSWLSISPFEHFAPSKSTRTSMPRGGVERQVSSPGCLRSFRANVTYSAIRGSLARSQRFAHSTLNRRLLSPPSCSRCI
jgi:hypothetical protein